MGNSHASQVRVNRSSIEGVPRFNPPREHKRHGVVSLKVHTINARNAEDQVSHVLSPKGALLYGSLFNPGVVLKAMESAHYPLLLPLELMVPDSRAHKLLIAYVQGWQLIPFPEVFSRHSGTCVIVGDRSTASISYRVKVGDCFRLGSVGVVVSELKLEGEEEEKLDAKTLQFLKDEALAFDTSEDLAGLATDEMEGGNKGGEQREGEREAPPSEEVDDCMPNYQAGLTNGEKYICYMCYETYNTFEDPLIAPCECKGDTRFLHVQCLQKWYHSSAQGTRAQVIRTTGNGAPACKICGTAYKTNFKRPDGRKASILEMENNGPYLSLVVVTHHDTNPGLFNTKFRLNFGRRASAPAHLTDEELNTIVIGRSSSCNMILDYRTVSTVHAKISYEQGKFVLTDNRSSNGTMVYLQHPFPLQYSQVIKLRMGRTTLTVQAKRSWTAAIRSYLFSSGRSRVQSNGSNTPLTNVSFDANDPSSNVALDMTQPTPSYVHELLAALPISPNEKNESRSESQEHDFLHARSYTIRTLNDASAEGLEYEREMFSNGLYNLPPLHPSGLYPNGQFVMNLNQSGPAMLYLNPNHTHSNGTLDSPGRLFNQMNTLRPAIFHRPSTLIADETDGQVGPELAGARGFREGDAVQPSRYVTEIDGAEGEEVGLGERGEGGVGEMLGGEDNDNERRNVEAEQEEGETPVKGKAAFMSLSPSLPLFEELEETQATLPPMSGLLGQEKKSEEQGRESSPFPKSSKHSTLILSDALHSAPSPLSLSLSLSHSPSMSREEEVLLLRPAATAFTSHSSQAVAGGQKAGQSGAEGQGEGEKEREKTTKVVQEEAGERSEGAGIGEDREQAREKEQAV